MPGTLFLDALKKKEVLRKGYPLGEGRMVKEQGSSLFHGSNKNDLPDDKALYRAPSLLGRAINRLREATKPQADPFLQGRHNIESRNEAEKLPEGGIERDAESIINQGVTSKKRRK